MNYLDQAANFIAPFEGFCAVPYNDIGGKPTVGFGHLIKPGESFTMLTRDEGLALLAKDLIITDNQITKLVKIPLNDNQRVALLSFAFNVGAGALAKSTLLKKLNAGDFEGAAEQFLRWNKAGGRVIDGLTKRRLAEQKLFLTEDA